MLEEALCFFPTNQCSSNSNHMKKKCGFFFNGIFEMALDYEANVHLVYFSEKLRKVFQRNTAANFLLSKYIVGIHTYTSNFPLKKGKFSERNYLIRF